jgi:hypothetical protein
MHARSRPTLSDRLLTLPEGVVGEILDGQLHVHPRPTGPHGFAASSLGYDLIGRFSDSDAVSVAPFDAAVLYLDALRGPTG